MPTRKIADIGKLENRECYEREHYPPNMMVFSPGVYEHECLSCHHKQVFTVPSQCMERESGGVRCEKESGHQDEHACPDAMNHFLSKYTVTSRYGIFKEKK